MADLGEDSRGWGTPGLINGQESAFPTEDRASPRRRPGAPGGRAGPREAQTLAPPTCPSSARFPELQRFPGQG